MSIERSGVFNFMSMEESDRTTSFIPHKIGMKILQTLENARGIDKYQNLPRLMSGQDETVLSMMSAIVHDIAGLDKIEWIEGQASEKFERPGDIQASIIAKDKQWIRWIYKFGEGFCSSGLRSGYEFRIIDDFPIQIGHQNEKGIFSITREIAIWPKGAIPPGFTKPEKHPCEALRIILSPVKPARVIYQDSNGSHCAKSFDIESMVYGCLEPKLERIGHTPLWIEQFDEHFEIAGGLVRGRYAPIPSWAIKIPEVN